MKNPLCWLFGCEIKTDPEGGRRYSPSREKVVPCPANYCGRCGLKDGDPGNATTIGNAVDRRNLYRRTIPVWLMQWRNRRYSKKIAEYEKYWRSDEGRRDYLEYLDEQSKKLKQGLI